MKQQRSRNVPLHLSLKSSNLQYLNQLAAENRLSASDMLNLILNRLRDAELYELLSRAD